MRPRPDEKGSALVMAILISVILLITVPVLVMLVQQEAKQSVGHKRRTSAFHLAEAGQDRGFWKLQESGDIWTAASTGAVIAGFNGDVVYTDIPGGEYKVNFDSATYNGQPAVKVIGQGRNTTKEEVRTIEATYSRISLYGPVNVSGSMEYKPGMLIHWGPVVSYTNMDYQAQEVYFPQKWSAGFIKNRDSNPAAPNEDTTYAEWHAYQNLGTKPEIDVSTAVGKYYADKARAVRVPTPKKGICHLFPDSKTHKANHDFESKTSCSGFFTNLEEVAFSKYKSNVQYTFSCSTCVIFISGVGSAKADEAAGDAQLKDGSFLDVEALIVTGNIHVHTDEFANFGATIPVSAKSHYLDDDATHKSKQMNNLTAKGWWDTYYEPVGGEGGIYTILGGKGGVGTSFHGFLYVNDWHCSGGNNTIVGTVLVAQSMKVNTMTIYYDKGVADNVELSNASINRMTWEETLRSW